MAVDTQQVDLRMFPGLARAKFTTLTQRAGDCIFVPYSMLHAVEKIDDGLGVAVSYLLLHTDSVNSNQDLSTKTYHTDRCTHWPVFE